MFILGQGHSLKAADTRMPIDLACADRRPHARGFRDLCVPGHHEDSITEEPEGDQMEAEPIHCQGQLIRYLKEWGYL